MEQRYKEIFSDFGKKTLKCAVEACTSTFDGEKGVRMFSFPSNKDLCHKWVLFCGDAPVARWKGKSPLSKANYWRVCSLHFEEKCFCTPQRLKLNRGSVPSISSNALIREMGVPSPSSVNFLPALQSPVFFHSPTNFISCHSESPLLSTPIRSYSSRSLLPEFSSSDPSPSLTLSPLATPLLDVPTSPQHDHSSSSATSNHLNKEKGLSLSDINVKRRNEMSPGKARAFIYAKSKERCIKRLRKIVQQLRMERRRNRWDGINSIEHLLRSSLSESASVLLVSQLKAAGKKPKGRRWTQDEKLLSLLLYKRSPKAYRLLRYLFSLPSRSTVTSILHSIPFSPGINPQIFASLSHSLGQMEDCARTCVLMFDEMSIMEHCEYNTSLDLVMGYEDHGNNRRSKTLAKYSLVFMVCGILRKWKQPIAFYFSGSQTKSEVLVSLMEEVLQQCFMAGLHVIAIVCDMGANNVKAIRSMGSSIMHPFIKFESHTIYTIFDPPHLLKATRNLLINHDFVIPVQYGSDKFYGTASWVHIENAYQHSKGAILHRPLNKLTEDHICPQGAKKMKVKLAAQVMSRSLAVYVEEGCRSGWLPQGALATSAFLGTMNDLFDSMNGGGQGAYYKPLLKGVRMESSHFEFWEKAAALVSEWKIVKRTREGAMKFTAMPPSQQGWIHNLKAFPLLCKDLLTGPGAVIDCIPARCFNQDPIENLFSCIRGNCGSNTRPTTTQFISSLKTCIVNGLAFSANVSGRNCEEDDNKLLDSLRTWINTDNETTSVGDVESTAGYSGFLVTDANEEGAVNVSETLLAFVCNYLLRNILKQSNCQGCQAALLDSTVNPTAMMYYQGLCGQANNPTKELLDLVVYAVKVTESTLEKAPLSRNVAKLIKISIQKEADLHWIYSKCSYHAEEVASRVLDAIIKQSILWLCRQKNKK